MSLLEDVLDYETWLRKQCDVVEEGLATKHCRMAQSALKFFRATCFRFARTLPSLLPALGTAPCALSVGDAHIENWGTWRDAEGRLVWGVNDFDDAADLPYTYDLVRLATSVCLARDLPGSDRSCIAAIVAGYGAGLAAPSARFVDDSVPWMQKLVGLLNDRETGLRQDLQDAAVVQPPAAVVAALEQQLPAETTELCYKTWQRGGGSRGRPRYVAAGRWRGGPVIREAKALVPSAWDWAAEATRETACLAVAKGRYRSPDPFLAVHSNYIVRRLAADSVKIDLTDDDARDYGADLLSAMGADLAAVHLATAERGAISADLGQRHEDWLYDAAWAASRSARDDFNRWKDLVEDGTIAAMERQ